MSFKIISYATNNQKYLDYANRLIQNFADVGYENYNITYYGKAKNKMEGCLIKPTFILSKLYEYQNDVLYIDIDSIICGKPEINIDYNFDIGFVYTPEKKNLISDSIHYWKYNSVVIEFLKKWKELCDDITLKSLDHHRLIDVHEQFKNSILPIMFTDLRGYIRDWYKVEFSDSKQIIKY